MTDKLRERLSKIYTLVNQGATEGERAAAKAALDRIIEAHNIDESELETIHLKKYRFTFISEPELQLLCAIVKTFTEAFSRLLKGKKYIVASLNHLEYITIDCAYQYYRRHMKKQWQKISVPELAKCRKLKTKAKRRKELQHLFVQRYIISSKLVKQEELTTVSITLNTKEGRDRMKMQSVEGGNYNTQLNRGLFLEN